MPVGALQMVWCRPLIFHIRGPGPVPQLSCKAARLEVVTTLQESWTGESPGPVGGSLPFPVSDFVHLGSSLTPF